MIDALLPDEGLPDIRAMHRVAVAGLAAARRRGCARTVRLSRRLLKKCRRILRFTARLKAGRVQTWLIDTRAAPTDPSCSHPLFSGTPEKQAAPTVPPVFADPERRHAFRERRRRR